MGSRTPREVATAPLSLEVAGILPLKGSSRTRLHRRKAGREGEQQEHDRSSQKGGNCRLSYHGDALNGSFHKATMFRFKI